MAFIMAAVGLMRHGPDIPVGNFQVQLLWFYFHVCSTPQKMPLTRVRKRYDGDEICLGEPFSTTHPYVEQAVFTITSAA